MVGWMYLNEKRSYYKYDNEGYMWSGDVVHNGRVTVGQTSDNRGVTVTMRKLMQYVVV
jgi:hypothetical protein